MKQTTKPWLPLDVGWWPNIAIELPKPWPRSAVLMDLRWWADQEQMGRKKRPGRPALCERWGWTDWQARATMKDEASWKARLQPASNAPPTPIQNGIPKPLESQEPTSSAHPAHIQPASTRADLQTTHNKQQTLKESSNEDLSVSELWKEINDMRKRAGEGRVLKLTPARRRALGSRLREFSRPDVLRVVEWWLFSQHTRAVFLREGGYTVDTLLRPKFSEYLEFSHQENQAPSKPKSLRDLMEEINEQRAPLNVIPFTSTNQE